MDSEEQERLAAEGVEILTRFDLTEYEAATYLALVRLDGGSAKDVDSITDVPRTRVYDAVEELHERGLVDIQYSSPQLFHPISDETTVKKFQHSYQSSIEELREVLRKLEPTERKSREQTGVWTVSGREAVTDRVEEFLSEAEDQVVYMCVEELLTDEMVEDLTELDAAGVTIYLGGISPESQARIQETVSGATMYETLWEWSDTPAGRLLMVDDDKTLVSVLVGEGGITERDETAIWGSGVENSLVVVLRAIFTYRLREE